jgi:Tfp pilus assembly protein PilF
MDAQNIATAEARLRALLRDDPANAFAIHDLGILAHRDHRLSEALHLLRQALALAPENVSILKSCAQLHRESNDPAQAAALFERALDLDPDDAPAWNALGVCLHECGEPVRSMEAYLHAIAVAPEMADAFYNMGNLLVGENDLPAAIEQFEQAVALDEHHKQAHTHLAIAHRHQLDYDRATAHFERAHALDPTSGDLAMGYGEILSLVYDPRAESKLREAVSHDPSQAEPHWNLALDLLKRGRYEEGFREYEWRWRRGHGHNVPRPFEQPYWLGDRDITGQTLLVHAEQGFGDTLQMLRYLPLLSERAKNIILEVQPELASLVSSWPEVTVIARGNALPDFDTHIAMMSLPLAFRTELESVPAPLRFSVTGPRHAGTGPRRIGLSWSGNPHHDRDRERSIPFHMLAPLLEIPGIEWLSLQPTLQAPSPLVQHALSDFKDTAELLATLDLVIAVDSAVAHLALSQQVPTWLLLPFVADWRWLAPTRPGLNPWYPAAHILRQSYPSCGWQPVLEQLRVLLTDDSLLNRPSQNP